MVILGASKRHIFLNPNFSPTPNELYGSPRIPDPRQPDPISRRVSGRARASRNGSTCSKRSAKETASKRSETISRRSFVPFRVSFVPRLGSFRMHSRGRRRARHDCVPRLCERSSSPQRAFRADWSVRPILCSTIASLDRQRTSLTQNFSDSCALLTMDMFLPLNYARRGFDDGIC